MSDFDREGLEKYYATYYRVTRMDTGDSKIVETWGNGEPQALRRARRSWSSGLRKFGQPPPMDGIELVAEKLDLDDVITVKGDNIRTPGCHTFRVADIVAVKKFFYTHTAQEVQPYATVSPGLNPDAGEALSDIVQAATPRQKGSFERLCDSLDEDILTEAYTPEDVDNELRKMGFDPEAIGQRGHSLVTRLFKKREQLAREKKEGNR